MPTPLPALRGDDDVDAIPIPAALLNGVGVLTLLGWLFWMLATGRLVTRREHENRIADKDSQIAMWRATSETKDAQNAELMEHSRLSVQMWEALEARAREGGQK